jgi:hypothetical protein
VVEEAVGISTSTLSWISIKILTREEKLEEYRSDSEYEDETQTGDRDGDEGMASSSSDFGPSGRYLGKLSLSWGRG